MICQPQHERLDFTAAELDRDERMIRKIGTAVEGGGEKFVTGVSTPRWDRKRHIVHRLRNDSFNNRLISPRSRWIDFVKEKKRRVQVRLIILR